MICHKCKKDIQMHDNITHIKGFKDHDHIIHQSCKEKSF